MPTVVSTVGLPVAQASPPDRPCRFRVTETVQKKLKRLAKDPGVDLWAEDEVHFQQHGSRCRMWIAPETTDPVVFHQPTRKSVGYFGAVRLRDGKFAYRREDCRFNAEPFSFFSSNSSKALVVQDDGSWSYWITLAIIMENFTRIGGHCIANNSNSTTCPLTVLNSTPLNLSGNLPVASACTTFTSSNSQN